MLSKLNIMASPATPLGSNSTSYTCHLYLKPATQRLCTHFLIQSDECNHVYNHDCYEH